MSNELIRLVDIRMRFGNEDVLKGINLQIMDHEFLTLLGPSGCGKTTTLRIIGGFETPTSGDLYFDDVRINDVPPYKRHVNTVFQKYALFPHLNVFENIAFGLRIAKLPERDIKTRVGEALELVNLPGFERRDIEAMSGGQQQRIAIARAIVNRPHVLLLDEPLGALDLKLRKDMQIELKRMQQQLGITFIYVTHDQEEALTMSDTVVVMNQGTIQQIGSPVDIYNEPQNSFVADFIGESNIIPGIMNRDYFVTFAGHGFECVDRGFSDDESVNVVIRPEDLKLVSDGSAKINGVVESVIFKGVHYEMMVLAQGFNWMVHSTVPETVGSPVGLTVLPFDIHIMERTDDPFALSVKQGSAEEGLGEDA